MLEYRENGFQHYQPYSAGRDDKKIELQGTLILFASTLT